MSNYTFNYSQYKKSINTKSNFSFTIIFVIIILLLGACVFIAPRKEKTLELYFVEIAQFQTFKLALNFSQKVCLESNSEYIYFDGNYHVLTNFYSDYNKAEKATNRLKTNYPKSNILTLTLKPYSHQPNLTKDQNLSIENFTLSCETLYLNLEQILCNHEKEKSSLARTQEMLKNLHENFTHAYNDFLSHFKTNSKYNLAKDYAHKMLTSAHTLQSADSENLLKIMQYELINFTILYHKFLSCF